VSSSGSPSRRVTRSRSRSTASRSTPRPARSPSRGTGSFCSRWDRGDLEIGAVDVIEDRRSYDPWWEDAVDVDWRELESAEPLDGGASLRFEGGVTGRLEVAPEGEDRFAMHLTVDAGAPVAFFRAHRPNGPD
jgi:hypothetical protein